MKQLFSFLILVFVLFASTRAEAQVGRFYTKDIAADTTVQTDTMVIGLTPRPLDDLYRYSYQIEVTNLSDTTEGYLYLQQSNSRTADAWVNTDTIALSGSSNYLLSGTLYGVRQRLRVLTTDGTTRYRVFAVLVKQD